MELQEILAKLSDDEKSVVNSAIEAERAKGIESARKKNSENVKLNGEIARYRDALRDTLDVDDIPSDADLKELIAGRFKAVAGKDSDFAKLKKEFDKLQKRLDEEAKQKAELQREIEHKTIYQTLSTSMKDQFHGHDLLIKDLISSGKVRSANGDIVFVDGESELDVTKGIETLKKSRPDLVRNIQAPGGGSAGNRTEKQTKTMPRTQFESLPGRERAAFMADGGKLI